MTGKENLVKPILDVFGGVDGGVAFTKLLFSIEGWQKESDPAAKELVRVVQDFSRLCKHYLESK